MKKVLTHKLKGFTLAEVMVTMALTAIVITFAYGTLSYVQKLFYSYKDQNRFVQEFTNFKQRMDHESIYSEFVTENGENTFSIKRDSTVTNLKFLPEVILMQRGNKCDTFHLAAKNIKSEYEKMSNSSERLLKELSFKVEFSKQAFNFQFTKEYDASVLLKIEKL